MRNIYVPVVKNKEATNKASTSKPKSIPPPKDTSKNVTDPKGKEKKEDNPRSSDQGKTSFSLEAKIAKIKISVPLNELLKNSEYHSKIATVLKPTGEVSAISDSQIFNMIVSPSYLDPMWMNLLMNMFPPSMSF